MNEPVRWRDSAGGAPEQLRALFASAVNDVPSETELARLAARLGPVLAVPAPAGHPGAGAASAVKGGVVAAAVAGAVALLVWRAGSNPPVPAHVPPPPSTESTSAAESPPAAGQPTPLSVSALPPGVGSPGSAVEAQQAVPQTSPAQPSRAAGHPAVSEAELLESARGALSSSPARALALAEQHRSRFPGGVLAQEREVIAIEALKRLGRTDEATRRAADFARRYPGSAYRKKLDTGPP